MTVAWTKRAQKRFRDRQNWIEQESCSLGIAVEWGRRITDEAQKLSSFPNMGRIVPEINRQEIREIIVAQTTRVIYKVSRNSCGILSVHRTRERIDASLRNL